MIVGGSPDTNVYLMGFELPFGMLNDILKPIISGSFYLESYLIRGGPSSVVTEPCFHLFHDTSDRWDMRQPPPPGEEVWEVGNLIPGNSIILQYIFGLYRVGIWMDEWERLLGGG